MTRAITSHAPIGDYRKRIWKDPDKENWKCSCGHHIEDFLHIYHRCPRWGDRRYTYRERSSLTTFLRFLQSNPEVFNFPDRQTPFDPNPFADPFSSDEPRGGEILLDARGRGVVDDLVTTLQNVRIGGNIDPIITSRRAGGGTTTRRLRNTGAPAVTAVPGQNLASRGAPRVRASTTLQRQHYTIVGQPARMTTFALPGGGPAITALSYTWRSPAALARRTSTTMHRIFFC